MRGLASHKENRIYMEGYGYINTDQTTAYKNFTPPGYSQYIILSQDVSPEEVEAQRLDLMPGFKFSWWFSGAEFTPDNKYKDYEMTKQFVR